MSTHRNWCIDGETTSLRAAVCLKRRIDYKGEGRLLNIIWFDRRATVAEITNSWNSRDPDTVSENTVRLDLLRLGRRADDLSKFHS